MKRQDYELFLKLLEQVQDEAHEALRKIDPKAYSGVTANYFDKNEVRLEGSEHWSFGGCENHSEWVDPKFFIDETKDEAFDQLRIDREKKAEAERVKAEALAEKNRLEKEKRAKAEYLRLKQIYDPPK